MDLGKTADGTSQAYLTFKLNNTTAEDVSMLKDRKHLQKLEISKNMICDLRHLSGMENLVYINVSGMHLKQRPQSQTTLSFAAARRRPLTAC